MRYPKRPIITALAILLALLSGFAISVTVSYAQGVVLSPSTLPNGQVGVAYSQTITASGGISGPYSFAHTGGTLPPGLSLPNTGVLSGTPTTAGTFTFTVSGFDCCAAEGTQEYTIEIADGMIAVSPTTLPDGEVGTFYTQTITATGGNPPHSFSLFAGSLPTGLTLLTDGTFSGTPTADGTFNFTIRAEDQDGRPGNRAYTVVITASPNPILSPTTLPDGEVGTFYSQTITASGGMPPYTFYTTAGALPDGLTLDPDGTLSGTPTTLGSSTFTVEAADQDDQTGDQEYTLVVNAPAITVNPATLPDGTRDVFYSQTITATGGTAPYTFAVTAGILPDGLTLDPDGTLSGTPTTGGTSSFTITATDDASETGGRAYSLFIAQPALTLSPETLPDGMIGVPYSQTLSISGGTPPYVVNQTGTLPPGLSFDTGTLLLSGTPTTSGTFNFSVSVDDDNGRNDTNNYALLINAPGIIVDPATLPNGELNVAYSQMLSASGGTAPYTFAVTAGALPDGLTLASDGTLDGTPTAEGEFNFTVTATDAFSVTGSRSYTVVIGSLAPPPVPLCEDHNFDENGVVRSSTADALGYAINCRVLYQNGSPTQWVNTPDNGASIGVEGILELGVVQAIDIFSPAGMTYFEGGAVFCLKGSGWLIWLAASGAPRVPQIVASYEVPEFPGFTCVTLFEPGTLVLVSQNPIR